MGWEGMVWHQIVTGGLFWKRRGNFQFHKMRGFFRLAEEPLVSPGVKLHELFRENHFIKIGQMKFKLQFTRLMCGNQIPLNNIYVF